MRAPRQICVLVATFSLVIASTAAAESIQLVGGAFKDGSSTLTFFDQAGGCVNFTHSNVPSGSGTVDASGGACLGFGYFNGFAEVSAQGGFLSTPSVRVIVDGSTTDRLFIGPSDPSLLGTTAIVRAVINVSGHISSEGNSFDGSSFADWYAEIIGSCLGCVVKGSTDNVSGYFGDTLPQSKSVELTVPIGQTFNLRLGYGFELGATKKSLGLGLSNLNASVDFCCTISWGGITEVLDANGNPFEFILTSESGVDWLGPLAPEQSTPVPEPGSLLLLGSGSATLFAKVRRRR